MNKSTLSQFTLKLVIAVLVVQFVLFWITKYGTFFWSLTGILFFIIPPMILPLTVIKTKPEMTLGGVLFLIPLLIFCYYQDFMVPYKGGGASMIYALTWIFGVPLAGLGMVVSLFVVRFFGIEVIDDE